jgi:hypothetical protein
MNDPEQDLCELTPEELELISGGENDFVQVGAASFGNLSGTNVSGGGHWTAQSNGTTAVAFATSHGTAGAGGTVNVGTTSFAVSKT